MEEILRLDSNSESLIVYKKGTRLVVEFDVTKIKQLTHKEIQKMLVILKNNVTDNLLNKVLNSTDSIDYIENNNNRLYITADEQLNIIIHLEDNNNTEYMILDQKMICELYKKLIHLDAEYDVV